MTSTVPPSPAPAPPDRTRVAADRIWAAGLVAVSLGLVILVLLNDGLRSDPLGKVVAAAAMTLLVASALYGVLPVPPSRRLPIALVSAAGFYLVLFPRLTGLLGFAQLLEGRVTHTSGFPAVADVTVRVPNSNVSVKTNELGEFVLRNVPQGTDSILLEHLGRDTLVAVITTGNRTYKVIRVPREVTSARVNLVAADWRMQSESCPGQSGVLSRLYVLDRTITANPETFGVLSPELQQGATLSIQLAGGASSTLVLSESHGLTPGRKVDPSPGEGTDLWHFDAPDGQFRVKLFACVTGQTAGDLEPPRALHWLERTVLT